MVAVGELARLGEVALALRLLEKPVRASPSSFLSVAAEASFSFSACHLRVSCRALLKVGEFLLQPREPVLGGAVGFLLQRLALDLHLHDVAVERVQLLGLRIDLHAQPRRSLVHQVDGLVGQEAVGDVAVGKLSRRDQRRIGDTDLVVLLVFLLDAAQDRDRVLDRRLADEDRLEAPRQRCILLDMLAVFIERRGADAMQLAARQRRLEQIGRVHRAIGLAGADQRMHLVDEQDDAAVRRGHFLTAPPSAAPRTRRGIWRRR